ncbi:zinc-ribbon domain-containing protein [Algirhabdus cladophorae]|uniref:zinc-ribbon domain-containing protein n=1 Tax=Algirhabdus cladophorae TaxID=3377108 RepID=UPI003B84A829
MRLICPNCGAQYEVSEDVIPQAGRDVQCSNCGQTWFQKHPSEDTELADELGETLPVEPEVWDSTPAPDFDDEPALEDVTLGSAPDDWYVEADTAPKADVDDTVSDVIEDAVKAEAHDAIAHGISEAPEFDDTGFDEADFDDTDFDEADFDDADTDNRSETERPSIPRRGLDPEIASILQQEAEFEKNARKSDDQGLETQGDLGLIEADPAVSKREAEIRERMADIQGIETPSDAPRRELLPDIEEINSSLSERTPKATGELTDFEYEIEHRRGFRFGFFLVASLVIFTVLLYAYGPQIVETIPVASGMIEDFTAYVDQSRIWLDDALQDFIAKVSAI